MNHPEDDQKKEAAKKKKNQIIFAISSISALLIVGVIAFFGLSKIKAIKTGDLLSGDILSQDQFEGGVEISSQLQAECQSSAIKLTKLQDNAALDLEYRQNAENCKDVYFALENNPPFRKEGMYADLVVDIARQISQTDKPKAIELLKFAREIKAWDFYLGPVSCDSQNVIDAYIETYALSENKSCYTMADIKTKMSPDLVKKDFSFLSKMIYENEVVWLGMPESDVGCPERIASVIEVLKKLTPGPVTIDDGPTEPNENNQLNLNIRLSDKESITLILETEQQCLKLSSVLVPNLEVSE